MKKLNTTQIIIGACMLLPLLALNSFAQSQSSTDTFSIEAINSLQGDTEEEITKILEEARISHEAKINQQRNQADTEIKDTAINEEFTASSAAETFKVLLPSSLQTIDFAKQKINLNKEKVSFELTLEWPYLRITVTQGEAPKNIKMSVIKSHDTVETTEKITRLDFTYETDQKSNSKKIGSVKSKIKPKPTRAQKAKLNEEIPIKDTVEVILPITKDTYDVEEKSFDKGYVSGYAKEEDGKIVVYLEKDYPLTEEMKVKFVEEKGKIVCMHKVGRKVYKDTISVKR